MGTIYIPTKKQQKSVYKAVFVLSFWFLLNIRSITMFSKKHNVLQVRVNSLNI